MAEAKTNLFRADWIGPIAGDRIVAPQRGQVFAAFASAFYIRFDQALVCVTTRRAGPGPLTLTTDGTELLDWRRIGITPGQPATVAPGWIDVAGLARIDLSSGRNWSPPAFPPVQPAAIARGLDSLRAVLSDGPAPQGFGRFLDAGYVPDGNDHANQTAAVPLAEARAWAARALGGASKQIDPAWAERLIGLGPGLTPAGDDFLGGMMIAFHALGAYGASDRLWRSIQPCLPHATNRISLALLEAAALGIGSASLHRTLNALLAGGTGLDEAVSKLAQIGHSSGWDSLTGAVSVLEAMPSARGLRAA